MGRGSNKNMHLFIGLGNPDEKYQYTRHNAGFMVLDALAKELSLVWKFNKKFSAELATDHANDRILVKPQTYMNNSGLAIRKIIDYYAISLENILVIHDDLDIELGKYKISFGSRSAGHNGVQSIIDHLGTKDFKRLRIGIKTVEKEKIPTEKFVLEKFSKEERDIVGKIIGEIMAEIKTII